MLAAFDLCLKCSHLFNILDARGAISVTERVGVIARIRALAVGVAKAYVDQQKRGGEFGRRNSPMPNAEQLAASIVTKPLAKDGLDGARSEARTVTRITSLLQPVVENDCSRNTV